MTQDATMGDIQMGEGALKVYNTAHASPGISKSALCELLPSPTEEIETAMEVLLNLGLLKTDDKGGVFAVATTSVLLRTCVALSHAVTEGQVHAQRLSALVANMDALRTVAGASSTERLHSLESVRQTIAALAARTQFEILTSQPGGPRPDEELTESFSRTRDTLKRGVRMRTLYQWSAQFSPSTTEFVHCLTDLGAEVRATHDSFMRLIVFDRKAALMSLQEVPEGALLVNDPDVVNFAVQAYERAWTVSRPFPTNYVKDNVFATSNDIKMSIMRLLTEGHEVAVISKRLGISQRTSQRHISEIMQRLGARNRLHAGYLISRKGLLEKPPVG